MKEEEGEKEEENYYCRTWKEDDIGQECVEKEEEDEKECFRKTEQDL